MLKENWNEPNCSAATWWFFLLSSAHPQPLALWWQQQRQWWYYPRLPHIAAAAAAAPWGWLWLCCLQHQLQIVMNTPAAGLLEMAASQSCFSPAPVAITYCEETAARFLEFVSTFWGLITQCLQHLISESKHLVAKRQSPKTLVALLRYFKTLCEQPQLTTNAFCALLQNTIHLSWAAFWISWRH